MSSSMSLMAVARVHMYTEVYIYIYIYYANLPFSYYSQFTVIIFIDNSVAGYIALLCTSIA